MGFPRIMYLSRAKVDAILGRDSFYEIPDTIKTKVNLSLNPSFEKEHSWKIGPASRLETDSWPPRDALALAMQTEDTLRNRKTVGGLSDLRSKQAFPVFKLGVYLTISDRQVVDGGLSATLRVPTIRQKLRTDLSVSNIAGVKPLDGGMEVRESGARFMLREARTKKGYPAIGLFAFEGKKSEVSVIYLASAAKAMSVMWGSRSVLDRSEQKTLEKGDFIWPE